MIYIEVKKDKWKELEHYHAEYIEETLPGRWKSFYKKEVPMTEIDVVCQILENHDMIKKESKELQIPNIIRWCTSEDIHTLADETLEDLFDGLTFEISEEKKQNCVKHIRYILGYQNFSGSSRIKTRDDRPWSRETFMDEIGIKVCPYCNRQYITSYSVSPEGKRIRKTTTDTDHYYPVSKFPFLSMNIHNMVPSCQICNSRLKLDKVSCKRDAHLYPYMDPSSSLEFQIPFSDVPQLYAFSEEDIHICLKGSEGVEKRAEQSKKIFRLEEVYETHRDIVYRLKNEIRDYSREEYNKIFCENYTDLFGGYDRFIEVLHPFLAEDEKNTPLTKMKKDIYFYLKENCSVLY